MQRPPKVIGIPWYTSENYLACLEVMADQEILPMEYDAWLAYALDTSNKIENSGGHSLKVLMDPVEFSSWCRSRKLLPDAKARMKYANFITFRTVVSSHES